MPRRPTGRPPGRQPGTFPATEREAKAERLRELWRDPAWRARQCRLLTATHTTERRAAESERKRKEHWTPERRAAHSVKMREAHRRKRVTNRPADSGDES